MAQDPSEQIDREMARLAQEMRSVGNQVLYAVSGRRVRQKTTRKQTLTQVRASRPRATAAASQQRTGQARNPRWRGPVARAGLDTKLRSRSESQLRDMMQATVVRSARGQDVTDDTRAISRELDRRGLHQTQRAWDTMFIPASTERERTYGAAGPADSRDSLASMVAATAAAAATADAAGEASGDDPAHTGLVTEEIPVVDPWVETPSPGAAASDDAMEPSAGGPEQGLVLAGSAAEVDPPTASAIDDEWFDVQDLENSIGTDEVATPSGFTTAELDPDRIAEIPGMDPITIDTVTDAIAAATPAVETAASAVMEAPAAAAAEM